MSWTNSLWVAISKLASCYTQVGISHVAAFNKLSGHWLTDIKRKYDHQSVYEMYLCINWWKDTRCTKRGVAIRNRSGGDYKEYDDGVVQVISELGHRMRDEHDHPSNWTLVFYLGRQAAAHSKPDFPDKLCFLIPPVHSQGHTGNEPHDPCCAICRVSSHWWAHPV